MNTYYLSAGRRPQAVRELTADIEGLRRRELETIDPDQRAGVSKRLQLQEQKLAKMLKKKR